MNTNVNLEAVLGVLAFLCACAVLFLVLLVAAHALLTNRIARFRFALVVGFGWLMIYTGVMLVFSLSSRERTLARGEEKHFCEIDCHLAYAVTEVVRAKAIGPPQNQAIADGLFYVVTIRTRFDEKTISSTRGDSPLYPNSRVAAVYDAQGRSYGPSAQGQRALALIQPSGTPIETPLRPGESYTTTFVFDLPEKIENPALLLNEGDLVTHLVIGHENSLLHKKVLFRLEETKSQVPSPEVPSQKLFL